MAGKWLAGYTIKHPRCESEQKEGSYQHIS